MTAKDEEDHIFDTVDYHATQIAKELDQRRRELYAGFRDNIKFGRLIRKESQRAKSEEVETEPDAEDDQ